MIVVYSGYKAALIGVEWYSRGKGRYHQKQVSQQIRAYPGSQGTLERPQQIQRGHASLRLRNSDGDAVVWRVSAGLPGLRVADFRGETAGQS